MQKRRLSLLGLFATVALASAPAFATPLNLTLADTPDIVAGFITVDYDAGTNMLDAAGTAFQLFDGAISSIAGGTFNLTGFVDEAGVLLGGVMNIGGTIASMGFNSGTLLTGTLTQIGSDPVGELMEFMFAVTGGDAATLFGDTAGIIMSDTGFSDWNFSFTSFIGSADVAPLPMAEPSILFLQAMGLMLIGLVRIRSRKTFA